MKKVYKFLILLSTVLLMSFVSNDCTILKNNTFSYRILKKNVFVVFKENKHIEYHNSKEFFIKSDIEWIDDCEYYLTIKEFNLPNFPFKLGTKMHVIVNKVRGNKVFYTTSLGDKTWNGQLTKVEKVKFKI
jgi:hypothetical protein